MKCDFCGTTFELDKAKNGCAGCAMSRACGKIKCPNCNYEMYPEPEHKLYKKLKKWGNALWRS